MNFLINFLGGLLHALSNRFLESPDPSSNVISVYEVDSGKKLFQYHPPNYFPKAHDIALNLEGNSSYVVDLSPKIYKFDIEF